MNHLKLHEIPQNHKKDRSNYLKYSIFISKNISKRFVNI